MTVDERDLFGETKYKMTKESEDKYIETSWDEMKAQMLQFIANANYLHERINVLEKWVSFLLSKNPDFMESHKEEIERLEDETKAKENPQN